MKELVNQIVAEYEVFAKNAEAQAEKGNKAAGARARKASAFVFGLNAASSSSLEQSGSTNVNSIPILFIVTANKLYVPP